MANSEEIFSSEIAQSELFVEALKEIKVEMDDIITTFDKELAVFKPKTLSDLQKGNNLLKKTTEATEAQTKVIKTLSFEEAKLRLQRQESNKQAKQAVILAREEATSLNALQIKLSQMQATYDKLSEAERNNAEVGKLLLGNIQQLDSQVKVLEESTGRHQRSVGNYGKAFGGLGKTVGSVTSLFGIHSEVLNRLELILIKSSNAIQGYEKSTKASKLAQQAGTEATTKATVAQRIYNSIVGKSTGAMKAFRISLAATGIGAIIFLLYEAASAMGLFGGESEEASGNIDTLKQSVDDFREATKHLNDALSNLKKTQLQNIVDVLKARINAGQKGLEIDLKNAEQDVINNDKRNLKIKIATNIAQQEFLKTKLQGNKDVQNELLKQLSEAEDKGDLFQQSIIKKKLEDNQSLINNLTDQEKIKAEADLKEKQAEYADLLAEQGAFNTEQIVGALETGKKINKADKQAKDERVKQEKDFNREIQQARIDLISNDTIKQIEQLKLNASFRTEDINNSVADEKKKAELILLINKKLYQDILALRQKSLDDLSKEDDDATNQIKESFKKERDKQKVIDKQKLEDQKIADQKRIDDAIATEETITKILLDALDTRLKAAQKQNQDELSEIDRNIKLQADRANLGLSNTLAEQEKLRADALERKAQLEEQAKKQAEIKQLTEMFFEFVKIYAKDGDKNAELKALVKTFAVKSISKVFSSGLYEGTESVGSEHAVADLWTNKDNLLVRLHPEERVLGYRDSMQLKGMSNKDLVRAGLHDKTRGLADVSVAEQMQGVMVKMLENKLDSLEKTVKNKTEQSVHCNGFGEMVQMTVQNGIKKVITHKH